MHTKKNIKIKNKTLAKIALTSVGCAIVGGGITEDHNLNNVKTQHLELVNNSKADINELFDVSNYVCPIIEQNYPTSSELMQSLIAFNPNYSNIDWDQLIVSYNGDGNAIVTAKENSLMYEGKKILPLATKIISTPTDCLLKEIGDTILISARLSGL
jgi:hypothetical protein